MNSTIIALYTDRANGLTFCHAPSLPAAIRADAEILVNLCILNNIVVSEYMLVTYILGNVTADVTKIGSAYTVEFYGDDKGRPFAIVSVN